MNFKASLHIHTREDWLEGYIIDYDIKQLIDEAEKLDFKVLGLTCHEKLVGQESHKQYAKERGILLIYGIELSLNDKYFFYDDVILLNINPEESQQIEAINTFEKLADFKNKHPDVFILAPHPLHDPLASIGYEKLIKYIGLFDGVESGWFYSKKINPNKTAEEICKKYNKPFIATSDIHRLTYFNSDYIVIEAETLDPNSVLAAIKKGKFTNHTISKNIYELIKYVISFQAEKILLYPLRFLHNKKYHLGRD